MTRSARLQKRDMDLFVSILKRGESGIKLIYKELFKNIEKSMSLDVFSQHVKTGNFAAIKQLLKTTGGIGLFEERVTEVLYSVGMLLGQKQTSLYQDALGVSIKRQIMSHSYMSMFSDLIDKQVLNLTKNVQEDVMSNISKVISSNRLEGVTTSGTIRDLKKLVPLSNRQAAALSSYQNKINSRGVQAQEMLKNPDITTKQFQIATRNLKSYENVDKIIAQKSKMMQETRAGIIARVEAAMFTNRVRFEHCKVLAVADRNRTYTKEWVCIDDDRTRDSHRLMASRYGKGSGIDMNAYFVGGERPLLHPTDPQGAIVDIIECRCRLRINVGKLKNQL